MQAQGPMAVMAAPRCQLFICNRYGVLYANAMFLFAIAMLSDRLLIKKTDFNTPFFSWLGWPILIQFEVVNKYMVRFDLR